MAEVLIAVLSERDKELADTSGMETLGALKTQTIYCNYFGAPEPDRHGEALVVLHSRAKALFRDF